MLQFKTICVLVASLFVFCTAAPAAAQAQSEVHAQINELAKYNQAAGELINGYTDILLRATDLSVELDDMASGEEPSASQLTDARTTLASFWEQKTQLDQQLALLGAAPVVDFKRLLKANTMLQPFAQRLSEDVKDILSIYGQQIEAITQNDLETYASLAQDDIRVTVLAIEAENVLLESSKSSVQRDHPYIGYFDSLIASNIVVVEFLKFANGFANSTAEEDDAYLKSISSSAKEMKTSIDQMNRRIRSTSKSFRSLNKKQRKAGTAFTDCMQRMHDGEVAIFEAIKRYPDITATAIANGAFDDDLIAELTEVETIFSELSEKRGQQQVECQNLALKLVNMLPAEALEAVK